MVTFACAFDEPGKTGKLWVDIFPPLDLISINKFPVCCLIVSYLSKIVIGSHKILIFGHFISFFNMETSTLIPGFRFHPTDHELVLYYLKRKLMGKKIIVKAVAEVNIYDFSPWDLPDKSLLKSGDLEWFFFCPKSKKYGSGPRSNRATEKGFWKATGKDRKVEYNGRTVAMIKTLVFHLGPTSQGQRTNWVMHEYNMKDQKLEDQGIIQDMFVLCKIFEKEGAGPKNGAQYGAPFDEEKWDDDVASSSGCGPTNKPDLKQKGPADVSLTEPGSSTVTFTESYNKKDPGTIDKIAPQTTCSMSVTEPGSVTIASGNVTRVDTPVNDDDDVMYLEDMNTILGVSTEDANCSKKLEGVNEEDGIFGDLDNLIDLDELNMLKNDGREYTLEMLMGTDDLGVDLTRFSVD